MEGGETSKVVDNNNYHFYPKHKAWCVQLPSNFHLSESLASTAVTDDANELRPTADMAALLEDDTEE